MALFGVPRLDEVLMEDRQASSILLVSEPAVEAEPFLYQAARLRLQEGGEVVYVVTDRSPSRVRDALEGQGLRGVSNLFFVDAFSALLGIHDGNAPVLADPMDVQGLVRMIREAARNHPSAMLIFDSLSGLAMRADAAFSSEVQHLRAAMDEFPCAVGLYTKWGDDAMHPVLAGFSDQVLLTGVRQRITTNQYFRVGQLGGAPHVGAEPILYRTDAAGVHVYIPKIVVTGPEDAGKTTFIHAVCNSAVSTERMGTTVALDRGQIRRSGLMVEMFGSPGQERFSPLIAPMIRQAVGVVLMVDATRPESFERAKSMFQSIWDGGRCAVVAANKQDLDGALSPAEVAGWLNLPAGVSVVGCRASDLNSADSVVSLLIERILMGAHGGVTE